MNMSTFLYGANIRANGIRQHYLRFGGRGRVLVIVPGIVTPAVLWTDVANRLGKVFDTYILDVRGRGLSESGDHLDYSLDSSADDLLAFIEALKLGRVVLLGHSNGARIAIRAGRRDDPPFEHLILADPPVSGPGRRPYPSAIGPILTLLEAARRGEGWEGLIASPLPPWPEPLMRLRAEWLHTCDPRAAEITHRGFQENDIHSDLPKLKMPVALIGASRGGVISEADAEEILRLNPKIVFRRLEEAGHQMQVDNFEGFLALVGELLGVKL